MELPITERELDRIIAAMKSSGTRDIHTKLWSYKINYLNKNKRRNDGFS